MSVNKLLSPNLDVSLTDLVPTNFSVSVNKLLSTKSKVSVTELVVTKHKASIDHQVTANKTQGECSIKYGGKLTGCHNGGVIIGCNCNPEEVIILIILIVIVIHYTYGVIKACMVQRVYVSKPTSAHQCPYKLEPDQPITCSIHNWSECMCARVHALMHCEAHMHNVYDLTWTSYP